MAVQTQIQVRRGTASSWTSTNPTLAAGEWGLETDTGKYKVGNGSSVWTSLAYSSVLPSTLTAKGDILAASAASTPAALAVGNNGETIVADSSTSTGLRWQAPVNSNPVINSAMQIWQRGTSTTSTNGNGLFGADRWKVYSGTTGRTVSQQVTNDTTNLPNIQYCSRLSRDSGNTNTSAITYWQNFETINTRPYSGQTVTLSFYARKGANYSEASSNLSVVLRTGTGTDQDAFYSGYTGSTDALNTNKVLTTTWQRFTSTFSIGATVTEMAIGFTANFVGTAGAADYVEITGVQLEVGSVATPFKTYAGTIQGELAACQRYYSRVQAVTTGEFFGQGPANNSSGGLMYVNFPVRMRIAPTSIDYSLLFLQQYDSGGNYRTANVTSITLSNSGTQSANCNSTTAASFFSATGETIQLLSQAGLGYLGFNSEL